MEGTFDCDEKLSAESIDKLEELNLPTNTSIPSSKKYVSVECNEGLS